jgi:hypothetical protein
MKKPPIIAQYVTVVSRSPPKVRDCRVANQTFANHSAMFFIVIGQFSPKKRGHHSGRLFIKSQQPQQKHCAQLPPWFIFLSLSLLFSDSDRHTQHPRAFRHAGARGAVRPRARRKRGPAAECRVCIVCVNSEDEFHQSTLTPPHWQFVQLVSHQSMHQLWKPLLQSFEGRPFQNNDRVVYQQYVLLYLFVFQSRPVAPAVMQTAVM